MAMKRVEAAEPAPFVARRRTSAQDGKSASANLDRTLRLEVQLYGTDGAIADEMFEPGEEIYVIKIQQQGSRQRPSVLYQVKDAITQYLDEMSQKHAGAPADLDELVAWLSRGCHRMIFRWMGLFSAVGLNCLLSTAVRRGTRFQ